MIEVVFLGTSSMVPTKERNHSAVLISYKTQGNYTRAMEYHEKSLAIEEEIGNKQGVANSLTYIGEIYFNQGNYPFDHLAR